jgi:hypothetical protein
VSGNLRSWQKGQSGNPKGRPPGPSLDLVKSCRQLTPELVERLVALTAHKDPRVALQAITYVLDRGWGKARQAMEVEVGEPMIPASVIQRAAEEVRTKLLGYAGDGVGDGQGARPPSPVGDRSPMDHLRRELLGDTR